MPPRTRRVPRGGATPAANGDDASGPSSSATGSEPAPAAGAAAFEAASAADASEASMSAPARTAGSRSFKLRPKVVRRADEERRALAEQEEKKLLDRAAADDARRRRESQMRGGRGRGRGGRGRGRGDFAGGRDGLIRRTVAPDGPFSQIPGSVSQGRGRQGGGYSGGGSSGGGGFGSGGRGSGPSSGGFLSGSGPAVEVDLRLNTDMFTGRMADYADGEEAAVKDEFAAETISSTSSSKKVSHLLPMGIKREEPRDTGMVVAASAEEELEAADEGDAQDDADAEDSGSDLFIGNGDVTAAGVSADDDEVWSRAIKTQRGVKLIGPDGQEIEVTDIDTLAEKRQEIAAAAAAAGQAPGGEEGGGAAAAGEEGSGNAVKTKKRRAQKEKDPEDVIVEEGLQAMLHDLAIDPPRDPGTAPIAISSGESTADDEQQQQQQQRQKQQEAAAAEAPQREGRLFLFQFPPVLPSLRPFKPSAGAGGAGSVGGMVKQEVDEHSDVVMLDSVPSAAAAAENRTGSGDKDKDNGRKPSDIGEGGFLGTLTIRQSGRAELSWGGMTYEMMPGSDVQFLTTAVLLEEADEKPNAGDGQAAATAAAAGAGGNAFGMGPVGGKYNLVPVFSSETEWTVDPAELEMDDDDEEEEEEEEDDEDGEEEVEVD